jgi:DNA-binding LacI/PurR family transcriptional regulator
MGIIITSLIVKINTQFSWIYDTLIKILETDYEEARVGTKQPTLHDVARLAQVSHQTVSRVINNSPNVAIATRERVMNAIRSLNYRPNRAARSLITGRSQTLQVIDFDPNYITPIPSLITIAGEHGYHVGVSIVRQTDTIAEMHQLFDDLTSRIVDGFLLFAMDVAMDARLIKDLCRGIPFIQLGANPSPEVPAVVFDQRYGMEKLMNHLFELGHRQIAEITGLFTQNDGRVRHEVYMEMMQARGLDNSCWLEGDFTAKSGYHQTRKLLEQRKSFTALVCGNDEMALGALRALHEAGLRVPEDVSVVGFDDHPLGGFYEPPLTTIRQDYVEQARQGIDYLLRLIEDPETPVTHLVICPELVVRQSTGPVCGVP